MSATEALKAAHAAGIRLGIDGGDLTLEASAAPPPAVLDLLSRHKAGIVALLRPANDGWSTEDWLAFYDERAGIAEFDGRLSRDQAEARAVACCVAEWLNRNPVRSPPGSREIFASPLGVALPILVTGPQSHGAGQTSKASISPTYGASPTIWRAQDPRGLPRRRAYGEP